MVLPESVMLDVLSRLPVKTIMFCKCVCKNWRDLLSQPHFVRLHLSRSAEALMIENIDNRHGSLEWVDVEAGYRLHPVKSINLNRCVRDFSFLIYKVGSVNGLICCTHGFEDVYIFNPVLDEYMIVPAKPQIKLFELVGYGFGVSMAGEYKVIRFCQTITSITETNSYVYAVEIEVYTLGTGEWRVLGRTPYRSSWLWMVGLGIYLNSHVYWPYDGQVYDFDLDTETSNLFPSPPGPPKGHKQRLGVLKGRLSQYSWCSLGIEVWTMKEESWCKEIAIQENITELKVMLPLCLTEGLEGTSILMAYGLSKKELLAYCLNTNTILHQKQWDYCSRIMTYRPSFITLHVFESDYIRVRKLIPTR